MARSGLGWDMGSSWVKVVGIREEKRTLKLSTFGIEPLPPQSIVDGAIMNQSAVVEAIRSVWERNRIRGKEVALAIAGHSVIIKKIAEPVMAKAEVTEKMPWEAEHHIPAAQDDAR